MFWKPKKNGKQIAEELNLDAKKDEWLQKVLSKEEFTDFLLAEETSILYHLLLRNQEPSQERSPEVKQRMKQFIQEVQQIIKNASSSPKSERIHQIEGLIRQAEYRGGSKLTPDLYYFFRGFTNEERFEWDERNSDLKKEVYGIDPRLFDE